MMRALLILAVAARQWRHILIGRSTFAPESGRLRLSGSLPEEMRGGAKCILAQSARFLRKVGTSRS